MIMMTKMMLMTIVILILQLFDMMGNDPKMPGIMLDGDEHHGVLSRAGP